MQNDPLNTAPIQQFIQQVKNADLSKSREVKLDLVQAKNLAYTLGIVMARLEGDLEKFVKAAGSGANEVIEVKLDGGSDWK
jgi:hypothetical protein